MAVDVIQADYDQLEKIASCFGQQADNNTALLARLNQTVEQLRSGSWEGQAAGAFFAEMNGEIFPAMQRLTTALEQAQTVTLKAKVVIRQAEEEAAALFGGGSGGAVKTPNRDAEQFAPNYNTPPFGDYNNLANMPYLVLGPKASHQDLAAAVEQIYRINDFRKGRKYGIDEPVRIIKTGPNDYLVMVAGTDTGGDGHIGSNDWGSNLSSGRNVPSRYQLYVKQMIEQHIPPGANVNLVGHSQGGHVVMNLAGTQDLVDNYTIANVVTYGSSGSAPYNPRIGQGNYHNFLLNDDPIRLIEFDSGDGPFLGFNPLGLTGVGGSPSIDPTVISEFGGHTGYHHSDFLAGQQLPFNITQWEVVEVTSATDIPFDNSRLAWNDISNGWSNVNPLQMLRGGADLTFHVSATTSLAFAQNTTNSFTQHLPISIRTTIDRQFDSLGETIATTPRFTDAVGNTIENAWDYSVDTWNNFWRKN